MPSLLDPVAVPSGCGCQSVCVVCCCTPGYATVTFDPPVSLVSNPSPLFGGSTTDCSDAAFAGPETLPPATPGPGGATRYKLDRVAQGTTGASNPYEVYRYDLTCTLNDPGGNYRLLASFDSNCHFTDGAGTVYASGFGYRVLRRTDFTSIAVRGVGVDYQELQIPVASVACSAGVGTYRFPDGDSLWLARRVGAGSEFWYQAVPAGTLTVRFYCAAYGAAPMMMAAYAPPPQSPDALAPPTARHAVVTLAVGAKGRDLLAVSRPLMEAAARRWGADFRVIKGEDTGFNIGEKLRLYDYLKPYPAGYDRVFYLDADALILPTAPNPFDLFPAGRPYATDDLNGQPHAAEWIDRENSEVCESQGWDWGGPFRKYWNSGVWLVDAAHAPAFEPPAKPYPVYHCSEQHAVNERMRSRGFGVADFGREWNWQWWVESKMDPPAGTHVLHFSGMDPITNTDPDAHGRRLALMRQFATRKLPLECIHLGKREEFRAGCGGGFCLHRCGRGLPAVPGGFCQTCADFDSGG